MTNAADNEQIILLDDNGNEIGTAPKLASHHANTPLHKAFSCYVFNEPGQLLVTKRAESKKVWPGVWTNSLCGHPGPDESYEDAISRRAEQELGMHFTDIKLAVPDYRYKTALFNGVVENEICPIFFARADVNAKPNPAEVSDYRWMSWDDYQKDIAKNPNKYSFWAKDQLQQLIDSKLLRQYMK